MKSNFLHLPEHDAILSEAGFYVEAAEETASPAVVAVTAGFLHQHVAVAAEDRVRSGFSNRVGVAEAGDEGAVLQPPYAR
jgi:hypothetical protein